VTDGVREGAKVRPRQSVQAGEDTGQGGRQSDQAPDSGPNQYGDQSIVNSKTESTNQQGKKGQQGGQNGGGKQGNQQKQQGQEKK
jgi:hypothetical protein